MKSSECFQQWFVTGRASGQLTPHGILSTPLPPHCSLLLSKKDMVGWCYKRCEIVWSVTNRGCTCTEHMETKSQGELASPKARFPLPELTARINGPS